MSNVLNYLETYETDERQQSVSPPPQPPTLMWLGRKPISLYRHCRLNRNHKIHRYFYTYCILLHVFFYSFVVRYSVIIRRYRERARPGSST